MTTTSPAAFWTVPQIVRFLDIAESELRSPCFDSIPSIRDQAEDALESLAGLSRVARHSLRRDLETVRRKASNLIFDEIVGNVARNREELEAAE